MSRLTERGFTLIEIIAAVAISLIIMVVIVAYLKTGGQFLIENKSQQEVSMDLRTAMDAISQLFSRAEASTLIIEDAGAGLVTEPGASRARFETVSGEMIVITWNQDRTITVQETSAAGVARTPRTIAKNVTALHFTGDFRDPGLVFVTIRIDAKMDQSGRQERTKTSTIFNQAIRLNTSSS